MAQHGRGQQDVPRDLALQEAFEAFIQRTHVPGDFHARVMERVHPQRARRARWGWESFGTWWTQAWLPLGVYAATVCGLLSLALNVGLGYYAWQRMHAVTRLGYALTAAQAQVREVHAERHQWQTHQVALTDQLAALQAQARQTQAENHEWHARSAELTAQLATLEKQEQRTAPQEPLAKQGTDLGGRPYTMVELAQALFPEDRRLR